MREGTAGPRLLSAADCAGLLPRLFAVDHGAGQSLSPEVLRLLDAVEPGSFHCWDLARGQATELHYHEHDEHWLWSRGRTMLTIRLPDGRSESFEIGPGWVVYCVRGVEHGHQPLEDWACFESTGILRPGARTGHLHRSF